MGIYPHPQIIMGPRYATYQICQQQCRGNCNYKSFGGYYECTSSFNFMYVYIGVAAVFFVIALSVTITMMCLRQKRMRAAAIANQQMMESQFNEVDYLKQQQIMQINQNTNGVPMMMQPTYVQNVIPAFPQVVPTTQYKVPDQNTDQLTPPAM